MSRIPDRRRTAAYFLAATGSGLVAAGCATNEQSWNEVQPVSTTLVPSGREPAVGFSTGVLPLGSVPYDRRSLPMIDPGGQFVATQSGDAPEWSTLLAQAGAPEPTGTRVQIHGIDREVGATSLLWTSNAATILGRSADDTGFLVENTRRNGARWIGRAGWFGTGIEWLAADEHVNAFGCLGPDGRLAWSRRRTDGEHFDLVIRTGADEWTLGAQGGDWLLPTFSADGATLFALRLQDGRLEAVFMDATSPDGAGETLVRLPIADSVSRHDAYQSMASQTHLAGLDDTRGPVLLFWHPAATRMGIWRPASSPGAATLLTPGSIAASLDAGGLLLVATANELTLDDPAGSSTRTLLYGTHVPRRVGIDRWPYVVLSPGDDRVGLLALRLVREE